MDGRCVSCVFAVWVATSMAAVAETSVSDDCYDALVSARPVKQVPTDLPDCGPDCIVMRWPWFNNLEITNVLKGHVAGSQLWVLTLQHTNYISKPFIWALRRNTAGGYNAFIAWGEKPMRCAISTVPVAPYLRPSDGQTLEDLRRATVVAWDQRQ